jgi:hypothetical protein
VRARVLIIFANRIVNGNSCASENAARKDCCPENTESVGSGVTFLHGASAVRFHDTPRVAAISTVLRLGNVLRHFKLSLKLRRTIFFENIPSQKHLIYSEKLTGPKVLATVGLYNKFDRWSVPYPLIYTPFLYGIAVFSKKIPFRPGFMTRSVSYGCPILLTFSVPAR